MRRSTARLYPVLVYLMVTAVVSGESGAKDTVVFVCEHGTVKSVIAMALFNKLAEERGLAVHAVSRGITPDPSVPSAIVERLQADDLELGQFEPKILSKADLLDAARVVAIGVDTGAVTSSESVPVDHWSDIPPATQEYAASRDAMRSKVEKLLKALAHVKK